MKWPCGSFFRCSPFHYRSGLLQLYHSSPSNQFGDSKVVRYLKYYWFMKKNILLNFLTLHCFYSTVQFCDVNQMIERQCYGSATGIGSKLIFTFLRIIDSALKRKGCLTTTTIFIVNLKSNTMKNTLQRYEFLR